MSAANVIRRYDAVATAGSFAGSLRLTFPYDYKGEAGVILIVARKYPIHPPGKLRRDKAAV